MKRCVLSFLLILALLCPARAADGALRETAAHVLRTTPAPTVGAVGGEWAVIALARCGAADAPYLEAYRARAAAYCAARGGVPDARKHTESSRVILALTAAGGDARNAAGCDLTLPLGDYEATLRQGLNGPVWALLALDAGSYPMPYTPDARVHATRQTYVDLLLARQLDDGGWSLGGENGDPDVTAMTLQALAAYRLQPAAAEAIDAGVAFLSAAQDARGGFAAWDAESSESISQALIALSALGIAPDDPRFVKNGNTLTDALLAYRTPDGGFAHLPGGETNAMATEQALLALTALDRLARGESSLYRMDGSLRHPDVRALPVTAAGASFPDAGEHRAAVEALAARGVVNGRGGGIFDPGAPMTRAEFCAISVRALGLAPQAEDGAFTDVTDEWFAPCVGAAKRYGLFNGVGNGRFSPQGTVTRQEAAAVFLRAAALCGVKTDGAEAGSADGADEWARAAVAFCLESDVWDGAEGLREAIPRGEAAEGFFRLLSLAGLLDAEEA